jgi:hypothetical protein
MRIEPGDAVDYYPIGGFKYETLSGVETVDMDYERDGGSATIYIRRARIELWRAA